VLSRRWPVAELLFAPATVQGNDAPAEIAGALRRLGQERDLDVAILARGGGSAEDLSAFNTEAVARAIFAFPVPLVSGVGHETDETIADLVADLRAPTPSAAAERATPDLRQVAGSVNILERTMASASRAAAGVALGSVDGEVQRMERGIPSPLLLGHDVEGAIRDMHRTIENQCHGSRAHFEAAAARIAGLDPYATLARGFAIVQDARTRKVVRSTRTVKSGARLSVAVSDGAFWVEVS
jgi:exodeoxyribonuclease VII large subunit